MGVDTRERSVRKINSFFIVSSNTEAARKRAKLQFDAFTQL
jgi:hypothetical protein